jgi:hypothetical protein
MPAGRGSARKAALPAATRSLDVPMQLSVNAARPARIRPEHYFHSTNPVRPKGSDGRRYRGSAAAKLAGRSPTGGDQ